MDIDVNDLKLGQLKEINSLFGTGVHTANKYKFIKGQKICIRCVTMIYTGVVEEDLEDSVVLSSACWVADTGRWSEFLKDPSNKVNESEMYPNDSKVPIFKGVITDVCVLSHVVMETK